MNGHEFINFNCDSNSKTHEQEGIPLMRLISILRPFVTRQKEPVDFRVFSTKLPKKKIVIGNLENQHDRDEILRGLFVEPDPTDPKFVRLCEKFEAVGMKIANNPKRGIHRDYLQLRKEPGPYSDKDPGKQLIPEKATSWSWLSQATKSDSQEISLAESDNEIFLEAGKLKAWAAENGSNNPLSSNSEGATYATLVKRGQFLSDTLYNDCESMSSEKNQESYLPYNKCACHMSNPENENDMSWATEYGTDEVSSLAEVTRLSRSRLSPSPNPQFSEGDPDEDNRSISPYKSEASVFSDGISSEEDMEEEEPERESDENIIKRLKVSKRDASIIKNIIKEVASAERDQTVISNGMQSTMTKRRHWITNIQEEISTILQVFPAFRWKSMLIEEFERIKHSKYKKFCSKLELRLDRILATKEFTKQLQTKFSQCKEVMNSFKRASLKQDDKKYNELKYSVAILLLLYDKVPSFDCSKLVGYSNVDPNLSDDLAIKKIRRRDKNFPLLPYIVVLNGKLFDTDGKPCRIIIYTEKCSIVEANSFYQAVLMVYIIYWVFNLEYDKNVKDFYEYCDSLIYL